MTERIQKDFLLIHGIVSLVVGFFSGQTSLAKTAGRETSIFQCEIRIRTRKKFQKIIGDLQRTAVVTQIPTRVLARRDISLQGLFEPGAGKAPAAVGGARRQFECGCSFIGGETIEVA